MCFVFLGNAPKPMILGKFDIEQLAQNYANAATKPTLQASETNIFILGTCSGKKIIIKSIFIWRQGHLFQHHLANGESSFVWRHLNSTILVSNSVHSNVDERVLCIVFSFCTLRTCFSFIKRGWIWKILSLLFDCLGDFKIFLVHCKLVFRIQVILCIIFFLKLWNIDQF